MTACLTCRIVSGEHELLDGFKRLRAARLMGLSHLVVRPFDVSLRACKTAMLQLNRVGKGISGMEVVTVSKMCGGKGWGCPLVGCATYPRQ